MDRARVKLIATDGDAVDLVVSRLPSSADPAGVTESAGLVTLREARTYRYELTDGSWSRLEPAELFDADDGSRRSGRLLPGEAVGIVSIDATDESGHVYRGQLDVRSAKFEDEEAFSTMITDLASLAVES